MGSPRFSCIGEVTSVGAESFLARLIVADWNLTPARTAAVLIVFLNSAAIVRQFEPKSA
jgi:hypothetical protein